MGDRLVPADGVYLDPEEVLLRVVKEFPFVQIDRNAGEARRVKAIGCFETFKQASGKDAAMYDAIIAEHAKAAGKTYVVVVADDPNAPLGRLEFKVAPNDGLLFTYQGFDEEALRPQLERLARVLGYTIELV